MRNHAAVIQVKTEKYYIAYELLFETTMRNYDTVQVKKKKKKKKKIITLPKTVMNQSLKSFKKLQAESHYLTLAIRPTGQK